MKSQHAPGALPPRLGRPIMKLRIAVAAFASVATLAATGAVAAAASA
jgi:hypothetical protein